MTWEIGGVWGERKVALQIQWEIGRKLGREKVMSADTMKNRWELGREKGKVCRYTHNLISLAFLSNECIWYDQKPAAPKCHL